MREHLLCLGVMAFLPAAAPAQLAFDPIEVHPVFVSEDGPFLILVRDRWTDGCGGAVKTTVSSDTIDVVSTLTSPTIDAICPAVVVPFEKIVDPRAVAPDVTFASTVTVRYFFDAGNGPELVATRLAELATDATNPTAEVGSGGWITPGLARSGLFVDQQGSILSAMLSDYDENGLGRWHYTAGTVDGTAFVGTFERYSEIQCVTAPCDRAAPDGQGRVAMILRDRDELIVQYDGVLAPPEGREHDAYRYQHLRFERSPALAELDLAIPDLEGRWVAGVRGLVDRADSFRSVAIRFDRVENEGSIPAYVYRATALAPSDTLASPDFEIVCKDDRPVDGIRACTVMDFESPGGACFAPIPFEAVAYDRVSVPASCDPTFIFETTFELFRLDP